MPKKTHPISELDAKMNPEVLAKEKMAEQELEVSQNLVDVLAQMI